MANPYLSPSESSSRTPIVRNPRWYFAVSFVLALVGSVFAFPGAVLLNQELAWFPVSSGFYDVEIGGHPVSNAQAIRFFLGTTIALWIIAVIVGVAGLANGRKNRREGTSDIPTS